MVCQQRQEDEGEEPVQHRCPSCGFQLVPSLGNLSLDVPGCLCQVGSLHDGSADDQVACSGFHSPSRGCDPLLVTDSRTGGPDSWRDEYRFWPERLAQGRGFQHRSYHAIYPCLESQFCQLQSLIRHGSADPKVGEILLVQAGKGGDCDQAGSVRAEALCGIGGSLQHCFTPNGMNGHQGDPECAGHGDGIGHRSGYVMELEVQEDIPFVLRKGADDVGAGRGKELQANFHPHQLWRQLCQYRGDCGRVWHVECKDDFRFHMDALSDATDRQQISRAMPRFLEKYGADLQVVVTRLLIYKSGMRFLLYNVRYCAGIGRRFHMPFPGSGYLKRTHQVLDQVTAFIGEVKPDIVGLVEVDGGSFRSGWINQAEYIATSLGHYHSFSTKYGDRSWVRYFPVANKQMNAFLSSDVIHEERFLYFDHGIKRLVIQLELQKLTVFLVHLSIRFRHRQHQLCDLYSLVRDVRKPYLVAGDFNVFWGDPEIELFLAATGLRSANQQGVSTYPSWAPKRELDFILHSPGVRVTHFEAPCVTHSDHLPLICDFEIDGEDATNKPAVS